MDFKGSQAWATAAREPNRIRSRVPCGSTWTCRWLAPQLSESEQPEGYRVDCVALVARIGNAEAPEKPFGSSECVRQVQEGLMKSSSQGDLIGWKLGSANPKWPSPIGFCLGRLAGAYQGGNIDDPRTPSFSSPKPVQERRASRFVNCSKAIAVFLNEEKELLDSIYFFGQLRRAALKHRGDSIRI